MPDLTVAYYTANTEDPKFEGMIIRTLRNTIKPLRIPVVCISHKPMNFGKNICVGDVGLSAQNAWRQFQIGAMNAETRFVCSGEDDVIYAPDFFLFTPKRDDVFYIARPMYVLWNMRGKAKKYGLKVKGSESAVMVGREYLIDKIEEMLKGLGQWRKTVEPHGGIPLLFKDANIDYFQTKVASVTFKTDSDMHRRTNYQRGSSLREIPYYGKSHDLIRKYFG